jgi:glycosidase
MTLHPLLYQVNARAWLTDLGRRLGRPATLDDAPDDALDAWAALGFDWLYLLGAWQTGPAGRAVSLANPVWQREYREVLPDFTEADVSGSPFAVRAYTTHADFGGDAALARFRARLASRGLKLMLDFVPNHTAPDHPWAAGHPEFYVAGDDADLEREPHNYVRVATRHGERILARGRDPFFPGWPDTLQLNYRHAGLREAVVGELCRLADRCDGLRCDMAMLLLPEVIRRTWGERSRPADGGAPVDDPFWPWAVARVKQSHPDFAFMGEVYWDLEWVLQQQGFDSTYDKRLYDRLFAGDAAGVRAHLHAEPEFQRRSVRFLENHDEPRAAASFRPAMHDAAAAAAYLVPGVRFFHEGQLEGRRKRLPMHLGRRPDEPVDEHLRDAYRALLAVLRRGEVSDGEWRLLDAVPAWDGNPTWERFLAYLWEGPAGGRTLVCVNYGPEQGQCYVRLPAEGWRGRGVRLRDLLGPAVYDRDGGELAERGLFLDMPAWGRHAFEVTVG